MTDYKNVFVDTAPFIYYIEGSIGNPEYSYKAKRFFKNAHELDTKLYTSVITIEEYKVFPYRGLWTGNAPGDTPWKDVRGALLAGVKSSAYGDLDRRASPRLS